MFIHHMQHPVVEVGILHVLQSGLSLESTPLSANGGILGKDARVLELRVGATKALTQVLSR